MDDATTELSPDTSSGQGGELVARHRTSTRIWHWINAIAIFVMLMSGLMISNAHPHLYWGHYGANFDTPWFDPPEFPGFLTIPSSYDLALARHWHLAFAWVLAFGLLAYLIASLISRHVQRDLSLSREDVSPKHIWEDIKQHAQLKFPKGKEALRYNTLQKYSYVGVIFVLLPLLIITGMCMSPGLSPWTTGLLDLLGGRQTARSIHFLSAMGIGLFIVVHLALVILAGPFNEIRSMITGRWRLEPDSRAAQTEEPAGEPA